MKISDAIIEMIKSFDVCRLEAYINENGVPAIGMGHTGKDVTLGDKISASEAMRLFKKDIEPYEDAVNAINGKLLEKTRGYGGLSQRQFDALVSLVYNIGFGAIRKESVFYKTLMNGGRNNYDAIIRAFMNWSKVYANGTYQIVPSLRKRRATEAAWYVWGADWEKALSEHHIKDVELWASN